LLERFRVDRPAALSLKLMPELMPRPGRVPRVTQA
jgi:hypothetical protein